MTDSQWLADLSFMTQRHAKDDDPAEQIALAAQELLASVPDDEIRKAYLATDGQPGDVIAAARLTAIEQRKIDL